MKSKSSLIAISGGVVMVIGTFFPWVTVLGMTTSGFSGGSAAGIFIIVLAALIALLAFTGKLWGTIVALVLALLSGAWAVKQITDAGSLGASAGFGLYVILIGAVVALIGVAMGVRKPAQAVESVA